MKAFSIVSVFLVAACGIVPTFGAPIPSFELEKRNPLRAITSARFIQLMKTKPTIVNSLPVLFNSGCSEDLQSLDLIRDKKFDQYARKECHTVHDVLRKAGLKAGWTSRLEWGHVCGALAKTVDRSPLVLLGEEIDPESIWIEHEKPALEENQRVGEILMFKFDTKGVITQQKSLWGKLPKKDETGSSR